MIRYDAIFDALKEGIVTGRYGVDRPIPSERALMRMFGASRNAVRHAVDELEKAHFVRRRHGCRTEVAYGGRGRRIGLIPCVADSEFFQPLALKISQLCMDGGYSLLFAATGPHDAVELKVEDYAAKVRATVRDFVSQRVSGVLFQPVSFLPNARRINEEVLEIFRAAKIPVVLLDYDILEPPARSGCDVIGIDNVAAAARLCAHLIERGARRIHFFKRPNCSNVVMNRLRGVALGAVTGGLAWGPDCVLECDLTDGRAIRRHLQGRNRPDAVVCGFDAMAPYLLSAATAAGLSVPKDLMIAGFDDSDSAKLMSPPLTTIHQPCAEIATAAFLRLEARMREPDLSPQEIFLNAPLVERDSTARNEMMAKQKRKETAK